MQTQKSHQLNGAKETTAQNDALQKELLFRHSFWKKMLKKKKNHSGQPFQNVVKTIFGVAVAVWKKKIKIHIFFSFQKDTMHKFTHKSCQLTSFLHIPALASI